MTNLSQLRAELAENKMDVLTPQSAILVKGGWNSGSSKSKKKNSGKKNSKGGNNRCGH
jgi:hypothetical protein